MKFKTFISTLDVVTLATSNIVVITTCGNIVASPVPSCINTCNILKTRIDYDTKTIYIHVDIDMNKITAAKLLETTRRNIGDENSTHFGKNLDGLEVCRGKEQPPMRVIQITDTDCK